MGPRSSGEGCRIPSNASDARQATCNHRALGEAAALPADGQRDKCPAAVMDRARTGQFDVVIPVHNQARELRECVLALRSAEIGPGTTVVVDDASTDGTADAAESLPVSVLRCPTNVGPAAARNLGARQGCGAIILFVDADVVIAAGAVERMLTTFRSRPDVAAVFGSYDDEPSAPSLISQYRNLLHHFVHQKGAGEASTFWTGCGAVRREAFEAIGGFDERRALNFIEDVEFGHRLRQAGYRILLDKHLRATHLKRWGLISMIKTDLFNRALPWSRLILANRQFSGDLNLAWPHRCSVALTGLGGVSLAVGIFSPQALLISVVAVAGVAVLNARFFDFLLRKRGPLFAAACLPLHLIHYGCAGMGFAFAWSESKLRLLARLWGGAREVRPQSLGS